MVLPLIVPEPIVVRPSLKVTVPAADGLTVAVSVTVAPWTALVAGETLSEVVVLVGAEPLAPGVVGSNTGAELLAGADELAIGTAPAGRVTPSSAL